MSLKDTKVGDYIAASAPRGWNDRTIRKLRVTKATGTQVTSEDGFRWLRRSGIQVGATGNSWNRTFARPWDEDIHPAEVAKAEMRTLRLSVCSFFRDSKPPLTDDQWIRVKAICDEPTPTKGASDAS